MSINRSRAAFAAAFAVVSPLLCQAVPDRSESHFLGVDSGYVSNANTSPAARGMAIPDGPAFAGLHLFNQVVEIGTVSAVSAGGDAEIQ